MKNILWRKISNVFGSVRGSVQVCSLINAITLESQLTFMFFDVADDVADN